jgi:hypothetical protein
MQNDDQMLGKEEKVFVGRIDCKLPSHRNSADEKICIGTLDALGAANIEELGCRDKVICRELDAGIIWISVPY